jgi:hypothetical protein
MEVDESERLHAANLEKADDVVDFMLGVDDALDPVTRAAVIARLSSDEVKRVRDQRRSST